MISLKKKYILAVDVGGTSIECGLFDLSGNLLSSSMLETMYVLRTDVAECIAVEMRDILSEHGISLDEVCCIGLGVPGLVDTKAGVIIKAPSLKWNQYPLKEKLQRLLGIPVFIGNDVNTGLLGEVEKGSLKNVNHAVYLMIGTSIGAGLLINGEVYEGSHFSAGELGYVVTDQTVIREGFTPARPGYGYLSSKAGGFSMSFEFEQRTGVQVSAQQLFEQAGSGDFTAGKIIEEAVSHITAALINIAAVLNPEVILISGGVGSQLSPFLEQMDGNLEKYVPIKPELRISSMQNRSVLYGAFSLCRKQLKNL